jgi:hypothetical protein
VTRYFVAVPATVVIVPLVPFILSASIPMTIVEVPAIVCVVKTTVAVPLPFVVLVAAAKDPLAFVLLHVTILPDVLMELLFTSESCAVIVTVLPAAGLLLLEVTMYFVAAPATVVIVPLVPFKLSASFPVIVVEVPATVDVVKTTVAIPLSFVVLVGLANDPLVFDLLHITTLPAALIALFCESASCAVIVTVLPATGLLLLEVTMYLLAEPIVKVTVASSVIAAPTSVPVILAVPTIVVEVKIAV